MAAVKLPIRWARIMSGCQKAANGMLRAVLHKEVKARNSKVVSSRGKRISERGDRWQSVNLAS